MNQLYTSSQKISIVLPCYNEERAIVGCLDKILNVTKENSLCIELIIVDNNSSDNTSKILTEYSERFPELRIVYEKERGYGSALMAGIESATGQYVYMADCDDTYNFSDIPNFVKELDLGADMVIGNRFSGKMESGAMPLHKKYIGNPLLSFMTRKLFNIKTHDIHCGARAFRKDVYEQLSLYTTGMEFASEMIIKASKRNFKIREIPIAYNKRIGESKLNTIGDGWRHLRFMLLYSPLFLFLLPGLSLFLLGIICLGVFYFGNPEFMGLKLFFHPMFLFSTMTIIGYQLTLFSMYAKIYAITHLGESDPLFEKLFKLFTIEKAGAVGILFALVGSLIYLTIFINWVQSDFGNLQETKNSIVALTFITIGIQTVFSAFMLSILGIKEK